VGGVAIDEYFRGKEKLCCLAKEYNRYENAFPATSCQYSSSFNTSRDGPLHRARRFGGAKIDEGFNAKQLFADEKTQRGAEKWRVDTQLEHRFHS
jgi:hypothetical protein